MSRNEIPSGRNIRYERDDRPPVASTAGLTAGKQDAQAVLEFIAAAGDENLEDRLAVSTDHATRRPIERDLSLRMLRHHASSVVHQQYHELDIVTVHVDVPDPDRRKGA